MSVPTHALNRFDLEHRVVLITGASSGIGAHAAQLFAAAGCRVVLTARRQERIDALAASLREAGAKAEALVMDVGCREGIEAVVAGVVERHGGIDVLLNNAGIAATSRFLEMSEEQWSSVIDTDLTGVWRVGQIVGREMVDRGAGAIVNIASVLGLGVQPGQANYASAKAAVIQLTRIMALELGRKGVRVNALAPGYFETEINQSFFASDKGRQYLSGLFPGRSGKLDELDGPLLLLASDAGSYIQGSVLTVDGGTLLGNF